MASNTSEVHNHSYSTGQDIAFAVMYSFIVIIGVPANSIVITIVRKTPSMHTTTNYLLMNLAVADLITLMICPGMYDFALKKVRLDKTLGDFICKFFAGNAVVPITINAAALTVSAIAVERYLALVKPFYTRLRLTKKRVPRVVAFIWTFAVLSCIPDLVTNTTEPNHHSTYPCKRPWSLDEYFRHKGFLIFTGVFFGLIPSCIIFFCYFGIFRGLFITETICTAPKGPERSSNAALEDQRSKKQLFKLLLWLMILFCTCTLPFSIFFICLTTLKTNTVVNNRQYLFVVHRMVRFLLTANSFFNPLVYAFQSANYREGFKRIFYCKRLTEENK
ncbi:substance-P receptor-like [Orbicella faveolata]|uniref:substance-P receptor-like n=1 Tax=Orbicella faveolata TaxID=48498 RepID=UPI0009E623A9|nr:substance-P receptor-like [Orbicella faveolata]